jgi:hypothetical protein
MRGGESFVANQGLLKYGIRIEISFFCAQSLALESHSQQTRGSMNIMVWRLR